MKILLFLYLLLVLVLTFVLPSWRVWRQTGLNPITFGIGDSAHDFIGRCFKVLLAGLTLTVGVSAFGDEAYRYLIPVWWLEIPAVQWIGLALLAATLVWVSIAQGQMESVLADRN